MRHRAVVGTQSRHVLAPTPGLTGVDSDLPLNEMVHVVGGSIGWLRCWECMFQWQVRRHVVEDVLGFEN